MKNIDEQIIEIIKDCFVGCGVKQKKDGSIVTYFTPYSATEFTDKLTEDILNLIQKEREEAFIAGERNYQDRLKLDAEKIKESAVKDYMVWRHDRKLHPYELDALYREYLSQTKEDEGYASVKDWQESEGKYD